MGRKKAPIIESKATTSSEMNRRQEGNNTASSDVSKEEEEEEEVTPLSMPINVYFRVTYPLVRIDMEDDDSDEEDAIELNVTPRFIFVASLCLVCMEPGKELCQGCGMVSYCSQRHQKQAYAKHRHLCEALTEIRLIEEFSLAVGELSAEYYRVYRLKLLEALANEIGRPLQLWEREIVLYPRVCRICHRAPNDLMCCTDCYMEFFCKDHENEHEKWCQEFRVFRRCLFMQTRHGRADPKLPSIRRELPFELPNNFDSLMLEIYGRTPYYCEMDCYTYSSLSHMSTIPLTSLYSLQTSRSDWASINSLAIHIIGAEFLFECINLHVWEKLFAHFLPNLKRLSLVFVGPELQLPHNIPVDFLSRIRLCTACRSSGFFINVSFHPGKFYHDIIRLDSLIKPDLVCLFNPGLYRETGFAGFDTWPDTIREFCKTGVPVAVTSYTEAEIPREIDRIKSIAEVDVLLEPQRNPYASIKPDRNFVSEDSAPLIYKNYYLTIVKGKAEVPEGKVLFV